MLHYNRLAINCLSRRRLFIYLFFAIRATSLPVLLCVTRAATEPANQQERSYNFNYKGRV